MRARSPVRDRFRRSGGARAATPGAPASTWTTGRRRPRRYGRTPAPGPDPVPTRPSTPPHRRTLAPTSTIAVANNCEGEYIPSRPADKRAASGPGRPRLALGLVGIGCRGRCRSGGLGRAGWRGRGRLTKPLGFLLLLLG